MLGKYRLQKLLLACGLFAACGPLWAATATTTFGVSGTVVTSCTVTAAALAFGATIPTPINSDVDANGSVTATCSNTLPYNIGLSVGLGTGATVASRKLSFGVNLINYSLYQNVGRTVLWGNTVGTDTVGGTGNGAAQAITVFGRIFGTGQTPPPGTYNDTITATITF